jgi:RNA recognition motif-containing protein
MITRTGDEYVMQLYVGGLSDNTAEADIEKIFPEVCLPQLVTIIRDIESGKSRGFAVVKMPKIL